MFFFHSNLTGSFFSLLIFNQKIYQESIIFEMITSTKPILLKIETKFNDSHHFSSHHKKIDQKNQPWKRNVSAKRLKRAAHKSNEWGKTIFSYIRKKLTLTYIDGVDFVRRILLFWPLDLFLYEKFYGVFLNWKKIDTRIVLCQ